MTIQIIGGDTSFKKEAILCSKGIAGDMCIDISKVHTSSYNNTLYCNSDITIVSKRPSSSGLILENILKAYVFPMEYAIIKSHMHEIEKMSVLQICNFYNSLKESINKREPCVITDYSVRSVTEQSISSRTMRKPASVSPSESISNVSARRSTTFHRSDKDEKSTISDWIEKSSMVSEGTIKDIEYKPSRVSTRSRSIVSSTASSRRSMSYAKGKEVTIYEE
jgi:hypothetical protein